jgi:mRNA interferase MazF
MVYYKNYDGWNSLKKHIEQVGGAIGDDFEKDPIATPNVKNREIWYLHLGCNLGMEADGKNNNFERPVLIFKKLSNSLFIGIPLTSKVKVGSWFFQITDEATGTPGVAVLSQVRVFDTKRLSRKIGKKLPREEFEKLKQSFTDLLFR